MILCLKKNQRENKLESCVSLNLALLAVMLKCPVEMSELVEKVRSCNTQLGHGQGLLSGFAGEVT